MKLSISHIDTGGAFKVAAFYAAVFKTDVLVKPSILSLFKTYAFKSKKVETVVFHNYMLATKLSWFFLLINPKCKIYCVEHYITTQIYRTELRSFKASLFFFASNRINKWLGVKPICLDKYSKRNRDLFWKNKDNTSIIINNPNLNPLNQKPDVYEYDLVWAAGLNDQKRWYDVVYILTQLSVLSEGKIKILVCSYDNLSQLEKEKFEKHGINFLQNCSDWQIKAKTFFFSSRYEGFPLALIEAVMHEMKIFAWCDKTCVYQILKDYPEHYFCSKNKNATDLPNILLDYITREKTYSKKMSGFEKYDPKNVSSMINML